MRFYLIRLVDNVICQIQNRRVENIDELEGVAFERDFDLPVHRLDTDQPQFFQIFESEVELERVVLVVILVELQVHRARSALFILDVSGDYRVPCGLQY